MKRSLHTIILSSLFIVLGVVSGAMAQPASAQKSINDLLNETGKAARYQVPNPDAQRFLLSQQVNRVIFAAMSVVGTLLLAMMVYAGWLYFTAQGNEDNVAKAKTIITRALIGLVILFSAYGVTVFVLSRFIGSAVNSL